jgi:hypothetical protein
LTWAFDLDGVLAAPVPESFFTVPWRKMNGVQRKGRSLRLLGWYERAPGEFVPPGEEGFHIITARKESVRAVTERWISAQPWGKRVLSLSMLNVSRTVRNVVEFKVGVVRVLGVTDFAEDNLAVVKGVLRGAECRVWHYRDKALHPLTRNP